MIYSNKAQCRLCGDIIESKYVHDFVQCKCGEIHVDGGTHYLKRGAMNFDNFIDLCVLSEDEDEEEVP